MKRILLSALIGAVLGAPIAIAADDDNEKAIKARRGAMQVRVFHAGPLFAMAKGQIEYDAEKASMLANNLSLEAQMQNGAMWPKGSDNQAYPGDTRALPEIWSTYPKIAEAGKAYKDAVSQLAATAGNGLGALKSSVSDLGKSCKGCHDDYRAEDF